MISYDKTRMHTSKELKIGGNIIFIEINHSSQRILKVTAEILKQYSEDYLKEVQVTYKKNDK